MDNLNETVFHEQVGRVAEVAVYAAVESVPHVEDDEDGAESAVTGLVYFGGRAWVARGTVSLTKPMTPEETDKFLGDFPDEELKK